MKPPMKCDELVELVTDCLEDALSDADRRWLEDHLSECEGCVNYVAQMRVTIGLTGARTTDDIDPQTWDAMLVAFTDES